MKLKQILQVLTAAAVSVCCLTAGLGVGATDYDCDINGDGAEDVLDVIVLNRYLIGEYSVSNPAIMDVNQNKVIDYADSDCIMAEAAGLTYSCSFLDLSE